MKTFQNVRQKCGICAPKCSNLLYKCVQNSGDIKSAPMRYKWGKTMSLGVIQPTLNREREY